MRAAMGMKGDALKRQGGQTGRGDIAWVVPSLSANGSSTRHTARSDFTGIPVALNLYLHTSSVAANSARSAQNVPSYCGNLGRCPMADTDMGGEAPETRPVPALPGHPGSLVLPDFHMATEALLHRASGHRRGTGAAPCPPETWPHSQAP